MIVTFPILIVLCVIGVVFYYFILNRYGGR